MTVAIQGTQLAALGVKVDQMMKALRKRAMIYVAAAFLLSLPATIVLAPSLAPSKTHEMSPEAAAKVLLDETATPQQRINAAGRLRNVAWLALAAIGTERRSSNEAVQSTCQVLWRQLEEKVQ